MANTRLASTNMHPSREGCHSKNDVERMFVGRFGPHRNATGFVFLRRLLIHQPVLDDLIRRASRYMLDHPDVGHMALTHHCSYGPYDTPPELWLQTIRQKVRYRISTQAGLWRAEPLCSYLDPVENGWMCEIFGTWRAHRRADVLLGTKWKNQLGGPAIDYLHTCIIKGTWHPQIAEVFEQKEFHIDLARRGYYVPKPAL